MAKAPLILVHAGMRPGEIIVAMADGSRPVFIPPVDLPYWFKVAPNLEQTKFALARFVKGVPENDVLAIFDNAQDAHDALGELHKALLEPASEIVHEIPQAAQSPIEQAWTKYKAGIILGLFFLLILFAVKTNPSHTTIAATPAAPSNAPAEPAPQQQPPQPQAAPQPATPGDALLNQIRKN